MSQTHLLRCCGCNEKVEARLTNGTEIYPHRPDLHSRMFWKCDTCGNYVGCHHKTKNGTAPLGNIPTPELRNARKHIHALIDPVWKAKKMSRNAIYEALSNKLGWQYHTAMIRSDDEAREVYRLAQNIVRQQGDA